MLQVLLTALCLSGLAFTAACGGDDSDDDKSAQATSGTGGSSGAAASGGSAGSTGLAPIPPVPCGSIMCSAPSSPITAIANMFGGGALAGALPRPAGCCLDEATEKCGLAEMAGGTCSAPAVVDTRCPAANLGMLGPLLGANSMAGCCIENKCGQDGRIFGLGCVDNAQVGSMLGQLGALAGGMFMVPPAQACDAPVMTKPDAGASGDDAGVSDLDAGK